MESAEATFVVRNYTRDEVIFKENDSSHHAFVIKSGTVNIHKMINNVEVLLARLSAGQIFGEMGIISGQPRTATAIAAQDCQLVVIDQQRLMETLNNAPLIIQALTKSLIERLRKANRHVIVQPSKNIFMRVCRIMKMAYMAAGAVDTAGHTGVDYSRITGEIRDILSLSRLEIDTLVERLSQSGIVRINESGSGTKSLVIPDPGSFLTSSQQMIESWYENLFFPVEDREFIDMYDFAQLVDSTPEAICRKLAEGQIPPDLFFLHYIIASRWIEREGKTVFQT